jgi:DNA-binding NtrC family response regulator
MSSQPKVLIVDDEERFRSTMKKFLSVHGLQANVAGSGREALQELTANPYDIVILDVRMPQMGGVEVLSEIKKIDPDIEVIIMTGYASLDTAQEIMKLGAYDFMLKPYVVEELIEKIQGAHDRKVARRQLIGEGTKASVSVP